MLEITPEGHPFYIPLNIGFYTECALAKFVV